MDDLHFHGFWRMDWGLGNPNNTAALIATMMGAVWLLAFWRKEGFWLAIILFTGLGVCLIHTFSRGGLVALVLGIIPLLFVAPRPWPKAKVISIIISVWIMVAVSILLQANQRYIKGVAQEDESITHRLLIWKMTPRMMVDAPDGWGFGQAAAAYEQWYQPLDHSERYLTLVNTHLTWMVEGGWGFRFFYLFAWLLVFRLCWPLREKSWMMVCFAVWSIFAIAAWFSSVACIIWLWLLPSVLLLAVLIERTLRKSWPPAIHWGMLVIATFFLGAAIYGIGQTTSKPMPIRHHGHVIIAGLGTPKGWLIVDEKIIGNPYGKALRLYATSKTNAIPPCLGLARSLSDVPANEKSFLALAGGFQGEEPSEIQNRLRELNPAHFFFFSPTFQPLEIGFTKEYRNKTEVFIGSFSNTCIPSDWIDFAQVRVVDGVGDYLADWPSLLFSASTFHP